MGAIRVNWINYYWESNFIIWHIMFLDQMPRDSFLLLLRCLHFSGNNIITHDRLFKIRLLTEWFNNEMLKVYYPGKDLSFDDGMILWHGRLLFRQGKMSGVWHQTNPIMWTRWSYFILCSVFQSGNSNVRKRPRSKSSQLMCRKLAINFTLTIFSIRVFT